MDGVKDSCASSGPFGEPVAKSGASRGHGIRKDILSLGLGLLLCQMERFSW